jgi:shikimate dehydrogenase
MPDSPSRRRAAVLGHPIAHSLSPVLHLAAYAELGLDWDYDRIDVTGDALADLLDSLDESWAGLSLTMPLKSDVLPLLDEVDPMAAATGAANTVVLDRGRRLGFNTDVDGIVETLDARDAARGTAAVLGGGATARSAVAALAARGATVVTAFVRRPEAVDDLHATATAVGCVLDVRGWADAAEGLRADVVISTVPTGVSDQLSSAVPDAPGTLLDVVYDPWPTALASAWSAHGGVVCSGLDLLLHQAVRQVRLMTGREATIAPMRAALLAATAAR